MNYIHNIQQWAFAIILLSCLALLPGCEGTGTQGKGLMSSTGRSGEMLVVSSDKQWKGDLGDSLQSIFMASLECLPQNESIFSLLHVTTEKFNAIYQKQRNILHIDISDKYLEPKMSIVKNKWASPQLIVYLSAKSEVEAIQVLSMKKQKIKELFLNSEIQRFQKAQRAQQDRIIDKKLQKKYKLSMAVPKGFMVAISNEDFCWLRKETKYWGQSILIYIQDYKSTSMLANPYIISLRNQMTQQYVFGSLDSSYMIVDEKYIPSQSEYFDFKGLYAIKTQGIWKMHGDFMGGPFLSYSLLDKSRNRIITIDGFLYAPTDDKRNLLRQIEAILLSSKIIE